MKKNAFTLIEMLMVLVLMGLILTIGIPSVIRIVANKSNEQYNAQIKVIEKATDLYALRYQGDLKEHKDAACFILNYQVLLDEDLVREENINCNGSIILKRKGNNNYKNSYFLNCIDKTNNKELSSYEGNDFIAASQGCVDLSELEDIVDSDVPAPSIKGGNSNWSSTAITIQLDDPGISESSVDHYEYHTSTEPKTPSRSAVATIVPSNKQVKIEDEGTTYIWYRVVNKKGEKSNWSNRQEANIDKTAPSKPTITASDGIASGNVHTKSFILTFTSSDVRPSGNVYYYAITTASSLPDTDINTEASIVNIDILDTSLKNKRIFVKACNGANMCNTTASNIASYLLAF